MPASKLFWDLGDRYLLLYPVTSLEKGPGANRSGSERRDMLSEWGSKGVPYVKVCRPQRCAVRLDSALSRHTLRILSYIPKRSQASIRRLSHLDFAGKSTAVISGAACEECCSGRREM